MTDEDRPGGPGLAYAIAGAVVGVVVSLAAGIFVAASLNTWLAVDWVRGVATVAVGVAVAVAMLRAVVQTARGRLRAIKGSDGSEP